MRLYVLRALLHKELLRLLANRGGLAMAAVMIVAAVLASAFGGSTLSSMTLGAASHCVIDHWKDDAWIEHLRRNVPPELAGRIQFRSLQGHKGLISYPPHAAGIQLRPQPDSDGGAPASYKIWVWYPDADGAATAPFEAWFWGESRRYFEKLVGVGTAEARATGREDALFWESTQRDFRDRLRAVLVESGRAEAIDQVPQIEVDRSRLLRRDGLELRAAMAMFLVLMALFFVCLFLMPSATAEERERGLLLAQALSPASSLEILGAKLLFYPALAVGLASLVAGICQPLVWTRPFFWLALGITTLGSVGIGLTLSVLARTQREASMGALSYLLAVGLLLLVCRQNELRIPAVLMIEHHGPMMLLAALNDSVRPAHWGQLGVSWVLAVVWCGLATALFRRFGWR